MFEADGMSYTSSDRTPRGRFINWFMMRIVPALTFVGLPLLVIGLIVAALIYALIDAVV